MEALRGRYVALLLRYVVWKQGRENARAVLPSLLKLLDAWLLMHREMAALALNLEPEEVGEGWEPEGLGWVVTCKEGRGSKCYMLDFLGFLWSTRIRDNNNSR